MPSDDANTRAKRIKRYAAVTKAVASGGARAVGARVLAARASTKDSPQIAGDFAPFLRALLGGLKGPAMKVAQMLAAIPDLLPEDIARELSQLQADAPHMDAAFVSRRMARELGPDWRKNFSAFDMRSARAASLGQVHRAVRADGGAAVACKLQYPDMDAIVQADLAQLRLILRLIERFSGAVETDAAYGEIAARFTEELDYRREARAMELFAHLLADVEGVHVPVPVFELSTRRLLTMNWLEGESLLEVAPKRGQGERNIMAARLFRAWYVPFYRAGLLHGDAHPGNYTVRPDGGINLFDFGCMRVFRPALVEAVRMLYLALRDKNEAQAVEAYRLWGFEAPSKTLIETLNIWAGFVYAPFLKDRVQSPAETNSTAQGRAAAAKMLGELRRTGGIAIPPEFVLLDRATIGLGSVFLRLGAEVNWMRLLMEVMEGFDPAAIAERQAAMLPAARL